MRSNCCVLFLYWHSLPLCRVNGTACIHVLLLCGLAFASLFASRPCVRVRELSQRFGLRCRRRRHRRRCRCRCCYWCSTNVSCFVSSVRIVDRGPLELGGELEWEYVRMISTYYYYYCSTTLNNVRFYCKPVFTFVNGDWHACLMPRSDANNIPFKFNLMSAIRRPPSGPSFIRPRPPLRPSPNVHKHNNA